MQKITLLALTLILSACSSSSKFATGTNVNEIGTPFSELEQLDICVYASQIYNEGDSIYVGGKGQTCINKKWVS